MLVSNISESIKKSLSGEKFNITFSQPFFVHFIIEIIMLLMCMKHMTCPDKHDI